MSCHRKWILTMAEKLPGEMTVPVSDSLRNNCMWSYRALWIGRRAEEETPVSSSLTCCSDPLGKKKNEMGLFCQLSTLAAAYNLFCSTLLLQPDWFLESSLQNFLAFQNSFWFLFWTGLYNLHIFPFCEFRKLSACYFVALDLVFFFPVSRFCLVGCFFLITSEFHLKLFASIET